jgi:hypothetical protein
MSFVIGPSTRDAQTIEARWFFQIYQEHSRKDRNENGEGKETHPWANTGAVPSLNLDLHLRVLDRTSSVEELLAMLDCPEDGVFITAPDQNQKLLFTWLYVLNDRLDTILDRRPPDIIDSFKLQFWHT